VKSSVSSIERVARKKVVEEGVTESSLR